MAMPHNRKRPRIDQLPQDDHPEKRVKGIQSTGAPSNYPPTFWDNLSTVWLTPRALRELDRRTSTRRRPQFSETEPEACSGDLARFARRGGQDLRHLRGFPEPKVHDKSSNRSPASQSRPTQLTKATTAKSGQSSACDENFQQHLADHGVYTNNRKSKLGNLHEIRISLAQERASLSPSRFSKGAFKAFQRDNDDAVFESDVMTKVIPVICGNADIPNQQDVLSTELEPITNDEAVGPKPYFFDGAHLQDMSEEVRRDQSLRSLDIPTKHPNVPVAVNFFLEVKGPDGTASVAHRQASFNGANGTRSMIAVQHHGEIEPTYDGNAYTYSSTYHDGTLKLYAHHATAPTTPNGRPEYHMTQLRTFRMTYARKTFVQGATVFRNARELAKRHRDMFIERANTRTAQAQRAQENLATAASMQYEEDSISEDFEDCVDHIPSKGEIDASSTPTHPNRLSMEDDSQDPGYVSLLDGEPSKNCTPSLTSNLDSYQAESKRQPSPHSSALEDQASKPRARRSARLESRTAHNLGYWHG